MYRKPFVSFLILLFVFATHSIVQAAEHGGHEDKKNKKHSKVCRDISVVPDLNCALAPTAAFDRDGRAWVVWVYAGHIYLSNSDDKGKTFSKPNTVNRIPENIYAKGENRPKIAFGPRNEIYLSWTQKLTKKRFSGHIRFSRSLDGGKSFSDPIIVNDHREVTSHRFDAMAVNKKGHIYIAWLDKRDLLAAKKEGKKYNGAALYYALSTDGGKMFNKNKKIADNSCQCCRVAMAIDNNQLPVIVWRHIFEKNIRDHGIVTFSKLDKANKPIRLTHDNWHIEGCPHHGPAISIADDNVYHVTWFNNAPEHHGLFYAHSSDKAASFSTPLSFGDYDKAAAHPHVLSIGKKVYIVWKEFDGKQFSLYLIHSSDSGKSWSSHKQLATTSAATDHPFLINDEGKVYASWHRAGEEYKLLQVAK